MSAFSRYIRFTPLGLLTGCLVATFFAGGCSTPSNNVPITGYGPGGYKGGAQTSSSSWFGEEPKKPRTPSDFIATQRPE